MLTGAGSSQCAYSISAESSSSSPKVCVAEARESFPRRTSSLVTLLAGIGFTACASTEHNAAFASVPSSAEDNLRAATPLGATAPARQSAVDPSLVPPEVNAAFPQASRNIFEVQLEALERDWVDLRETLENPDQLYRWAVREGLDAAIRQCERTLRNEAAQDSMDPFFSCSLPTPDDLALARECVRSVDLDGTSRLLSEMGAGYISEGNVWSFATRYAEERQARTPLVPTSVDFDWGVRLPSWKILRGDELSAGFRFRQTGWFGSLTQSCVFGEAGEHRFSLGYEKQISQRLSLWCMTEYQPEGGETIWIGMGTGQ